MASVPAHFPGSIVASRYRLVRELGRGAMGVVWEAEHLTLHAPVAVKLVDAELLEPDAEDREEVLGRFVREAQATALIRSPHVVQILDHGVDQNVPFMVMELLEGESLQDRLDRESRLSRVATANVISHVARAVGKAHEAGIVHRDLKPGNVFLVRNDEDEIAKVLDFGIAKFTRAQGSGGMLSTKAGLLIGTPAYMSPEQASGVDVVDFRSDVWALGVMAFQCLTGRLPFESEGVGELILQICAKPIPVPSQVAPVPDGFDEWFARAVTREPTDRFQSVKAMADALREILTGEQPTDPLMKRPAVVAAHSGIRPADLTHRAVVSQLHQARPHRSFVKILVASALATSLVGIAAFFLFFSGVSEETTAAHPTGEPSPASPVDSGMTVEPLGESVPDLPIDQATDDETAKVDDDAGTIQGGTAPDETSPAASAPAAPKVTPKGPFRPPATKKKPKQPDQETRLGF